MKIKRLTSWSLSIAMLIGITSFSGCDLKELINNSTEQEEAIPDSLHYPEKWEFEIVGGYAINYDEPYDWSRKVFELAEMDCPQGAINVGDILKNKQDIVINFSGYYNRYRYCPELAVYYYNSKGERIGPYYGGFYNSYRYKGDNGVSLEEAKADSRNWEEGDLWCAGWYKIEFKVYENDEEYRKKYYDFFYKPMYPGGDRTIKIYAKIENKKIEQM
nr:hypothetical protein [Clostridia bacterium]